MKSKIINKEVISLGKFEINVYNKKYFVYVEKKDDCKFSEFYITEDNSSVIIFCIGLQWEDLTSTIEEFINENILQWIADYNYNIEILEDNFYIPH